MNKIYVGVLAGNFYVDTRLLFKESQKKKMCLPGINFFYIM